MRGAAAVCTAALLLFATLSALKTFKGGEEGTARRGSVLLSVRLPALQQLAVGTTTFILSSVPPHASPSIADPSKSISSL